MLEKNEKLIICGDTNGHVGAKADGFEGVHGGKGFGIRNAEGEMLLEFADAIGLAVCNTHGSRKRIHRRLHTNQVAVRQ